MEQDWMMVYSTMDKFHAMYIKEILEKELILVVLFNKTEGPYAQGILQGEIELYVHYKQAEAALEFIYNLPE